MSHETKSFRLFGFMGQVSVSKVNIPLPPLLQEAVIDKPFETLTIHNIRLNKREEIMLHRADLLLYIWSFQK